MYATLTPLPAFRREHAVRAEYYLAWPVSSQANPTLLYANDGYRGFHTHK